MQYKIALQQRDEGVSASVPGLPGRWLQGDPERDALETIGVAIRAYLAARNHLLTDATVRAIERAS